MLAIRVSFNEHVKLDETLTWGMLKYGYCSYFALSYAKKHHYKRFLAIMEYDEFIEKEYLVHFLVINEHNEFIDAEGTYSNWMTSVKEMTDIEYMILKTYEVDEKFIKQRIAEDIDFDTTLYQTINDFVMNTY